MFSIIEGLDVGPWVCLTHTRIPGLRLLNGKHRWDLGFNLLGLNHPFSDDPLKYVLHDLVCCHD
jgi:hypothetical protein